MSKEIVAKTDNPTTKGNLNQTPDSVVTQNLPIKPLRNIIFKQRDISFGKIEKQYAEDLANGVVVPMGDDIPREGIDPGHYWVELYRDDKVYNESTLTESYGWYPFVDKDTDGKNDCDGEREVSERCREDARPGMLEGFSGTEGRLNRGHAFDPHATKEEIDWEANRSFYPMSTIGQNEEEVKECIRQFSNNYKKNYGGNWAWPSLKIENRNHCQTFQEQMMKHCNLVPSEVKVTHD